MQRALPDGAHPWLHVEPLDVAIGRVHAPYCPSRCHGGPQQKTQLLASDYEFFYLAKVVL